MRPLSMLSIDYYNQFSLSFPDYWTALQSITIKGYLVIVIIHLVLSDLAWPK